MGEWRMCDASIPGMNGGYYHLPYSEAVEGYRHGYMTKYEGVRWTRDADHPADPKCPECAGFMPEPPPVKPLPKGKHRYIDKRGAVRWTDKWDHPEDPECPECWKPIRESNEEKK